MSEFDSIYMVWRKGAGTPRLEVGVLKKITDGQHEFTYLPKAKDLVLSHGFTPYTEFPDLGKTYKNNVAEIFGQRLVKTERSDSRTYFDFWEVDQNKLNDKFYLLGKTQGLVPTDNFEFLADYQYGDDIHFVTEIAGLSDTLPLNLGGISVGDDLLFETEPENRYDSYAVKIIKTDRVIGYIKKCHNKIFQDERSKNLKLKVKALDLNGSIKHVFIRVSRD